MADSETISAFFLDQNLKKSVETIDKPFMTSSIMSKKNSVINIDDQTREFKQGIDMEHLYRVYANNRSVSNNRNSIKRQLPNLK
jgi:hypothetical protein